MDSIYDVIKQLPIIQGVDSKRLSDILEKTKVEFRNYADGESILTRGSEPQEVIYLISGNAFRRWSSPNFEIALSEKLMPYTLIGGGYFYGIDKRVPYNVVSAGAATMFCFPKVQLLRLLQSDQVLLINYLNYLSLRAQRPVTSLLEFGGDFFCEWLSSILFTVVDSKSVDVEIEFSEKFFNSFISATSTEERLFELQSKGLLKLEHNKISILSRQGVVKALSR